MSDTAKCLNSNSEFRYQYSWNSLPPKTKLYSIKGDEVIILFPGTINLEEGPDFNSGRIIFNGQEMCGDIEIHNLPGDWTRHGHNKNKQYDNVILHVVAEIKTREFSTDDLIPDIPILLFPDQFLITDKYNTDNKYPYGYCSSLFSKISNKELSFFFNDAGLQRFKEKSRLITQEILSEGIEKTFLKYYFDACGYKKNRDQFLELLNRLFQYDVTSMSKEDIIAVLWGESDLLPDPNTNGLSLEIKEFVDRIWNVWWRLRKNKKDKIQWHFSSVRPLNNPCRRVAAVASLISNYGISSFNLILDQFMVGSSGITKWKDFKTYLICHDDLWDKYSDFLHPLSSNAAVLGEQRALDIMVNVILPLIYAYSCIHSLNEEQIKATSILEALPGTQTNIILKICIQRWIIPIDRAKKVFKHGLTQQGALHIYKKFCSPSNMNCSNCELFLQLRKSLNIK